MKITDDAIELIDCGIKQLINYKGLTFDRALEGLTVGGFLLFYAYFSLSIKKAISNSF